MSKHVKDIESQDFFFFFFLRARILIRTLWLQRYLLNRKR